MANRIPRFQILARDGFRCIYCGATPRTTELHLDHLVPRSLGGSDETWNLATSCVSCNLSKSNMMPPDEVIRSVYDRDAEWPYLGRREKHKSCAHCRIPVLMEDGETEHVPDEWIRCEACDLAVCDAYQKGWNAGVEYAGTVL